jgi:hypothetical protein
VLAVVIVRENQHVLADVFVIDVVKHAHQIVLLCEQVQGAELFNVRVKVTRFAMRGRGTVPTRL